MNSVEPAALYGNVFHTAPVSDVFPTKIVLVILQFTPLAYPAQIAPPAVLALWDDLNPENANCNEYCAGRVLVNTDNDRAVIWYNDVARWYSGDMEAYFDFQIVLYPTGKIRINYRNIDGYHTATIGIQNQEGTDG